MDDDLKAHRQMLIKCYYALEHYVLERYGKDSPPPEIESLLHEAEILLDKHETRQDFFWRMPFGVLNHK